MKQILESIILNLVDNQSEVSIEEKAKDGSIVYEVKVAQSDMGRIIGRQGRIAKSIRTVVKSLGAKEKKRITVEFIG